MASKSRFMSMLCQQRTKLKQQCGHCSQTARGRLMRMVSTISAKASVLLLLMGHQTWWRWWRSFPWLSPTWRSASETMHMVSGHFAGRCWCNDCLIFGCHSLCKYMDVAIISRRFALNCEAPSCARIALQRPCEAEETVAKMRERLFGRRGIVPDLQNSHEWKTRLRAIQAVSNPNEKIFRSMSWSPIRFDSESEPCRTAS